MSKRKIFAVGFDFFPDAEIERITFDSNQSLLDADIILFEVGFTGLASYESYNGHPLFSEHSSAAVERCINHWRSELRAALQAGKMIVVYAIEPAIYYRYTGSVSFSGTGRNRARTNHVEPVLSYSPLSPWITAESKSGEQMRLVDGHASLTAYWKEFAQMHVYEAVLSGERIVPTLMTKSGDRIVGAEIRGKGLMLILPSLRLSEGVHWNYDTKGEHTEWTKEGQVFGKRYATAIVELYDRLMLTGERTPAPNWSLEDNYRTPDEVIVQSSIAQLESEVDALREEINVLQEKQIELGRIRGLLFEQGKPLEIAVRESLKVMGFSAEGLAEGDSEFDVVFHSTEGRCIGEVEGKDAKAINIDKLSQLERNIQEDYARDGVDEYAKGVLFGNAQRLNPVAERGEFFTQKCLTGAQRAGIALVRTPDLFAPAVYLRNNSDEAYAKACRDAIFEAKGRIVQFPPLPIEQLA